MTLEERKKLALFALIRQYERFIFELAKGEGSTMDLADTISTINGKKVRSPNPNDIKLILEIKDGLTFLVECLENDTVSFTKPFVCEINRRVAHFENRDNVGGFRKRLITIENSTNKGIDTVFLDEAFTKLQEDLIYSDYDKIAIFKNFAKMCKAQFFGDGNKRTSVLTMNGLLVSNGYAPFVFNFKENDIVRALLDYYDNNNIESICKICIEEEKKSAIAFGLEEVKANKPYMDIGFEPY